MVADSIFSVAPGEGHKPIGILTDEHFEKMCNPTKYPSGKSGMMSNSWLLASTSTRDSLLQMGGLPRMLSICNSTVCCWEQASCWRCEYYATANIRKAAPGTNTYSRCYQEPASDQANDTQRWCLPLLKECQRFTSLLSEGHVWCACDDQTAWFAHLVPHPVSSRHVVAGCHPDDRQTASMAPPSQKKM